MKQTFFRVGSFMLGFGFLGALDGIIFHQILQWHSVVMDTDRVGQIMSDGYFHLAVTTALVIGGFFLWLAGKPTAITSAVRHVIGWFLIGGGAFNLVEGIINHHILQIHRVKPGDPIALVYDLLYLASGVILLLAGFLIKRLKDKDKENSVNV